MVYLIVGSPCSGKSHYIKEHMTDGDIVCDVDLIYGAISNHDPHNADLYVHEVALLLRQQLLDIIRDRKGGWKDAYVTSIADTPEKLKADMERINADECIFIDTPIEVCMERAKERPFYFQWIIQEWFSNHREAVNNASINRQREA